MTGPTDKTPHRRTSDQGRKGRARSWWRDYGQLVTGTWLIVVSIVSFWVAIEFYQSQAATSRAAKLNCQRARAYGPALANFFERERAFPGRVLEQYRRTIPKTCPGDPGQ